MRTAFAVSKNYIRLYIYSDKHSEYRAIARFHPYCVDARTEIDTSSSITIDVNEKMTACTDCRHFAWQTADDFNLDQGRLVWLVTGEDEENE